MQKIKIFVKNLTSLNLIFIGVFLVLVYYSPYIIMGENSWFNFSYDSLDSNVIWAKILVESGKMFAPNNEIMLQAMSGLPRSCYPSEISIPIWFYYFFKPVIAYIINIIIVAISAFVGMFLLLKKIDKNANIYIVFLISFLYSILPYWPHGGLSVAGIPLIIYGILSVNKKPFIAYGLLLFYALYSSFVLTGIFLISILFLYLIVDWFISKKIPWRKIIYVGFLVLIYLLKDYRLILSTISPDFISHRGDFIMPTHSISESFNFLYSLLFKEWGHNTIIKLPIILSLFSLLIFEILFNRKKLKYNKEILLIFLIITFISFLAVLFQNTYFYNWYVKYFPFLKQIQLQRFYWLLLPLFYIMYFYILKKINLYKYGKYFILLIFVVHFGFILRTNSTYKQIIKTKVLKQEASKASFKSFYSESLYSDIDKYIGKLQNSYRVASVGLQPAVALYSGFYTVDGYYANYPKEYKGLIFNIIEGELVKNESLFKFFTNWGSVCLIPSAEMIEKKYNKKGFVVPEIRKSDNIDFVENLNINTSLLKNKLNCLYVFSATELGNYKELNMKYHGVFEDAISSYRVHLYEIL